mmetsp:Transcript_56133/g.114773  ORF Transcript_56133/g.114773 Transcript_56133/m.114773 type:complete len:306 (+) Transcript_56133:46-963(+)
MGGGASVGLSHKTSDYEQINDKFFQSLLSSKIARHELFKDIAKCKPENRIEAKGKISLRKLSWYFHNGNSASLYPGFVVNMDVLNAAFTYAVEKSNNNPVKSVKCATSTRSTKKSTAKINRKEVHLTERSFHEFLPLLLLFSRLWTIFDAVDNLVVQDQKIFKGEFIKIKKVLGGVVGITLIGDTSDQEWENEFNAIDKNSDGFISFDEACSYAIQRITEPFDYAPEVGNEYEDAHSEDTEDNRANFSTFASLIEVVANPVNEEEDVGGPATPTPKSIMNSTWFVVQSEEDLRKNDISNGKVMYV